MKHDFIIFGGTGLQGRICAKDFLENDYSVLLAGRNKSSITDLLKNKKASFLEVDLRDENKIINAIDKSNADIVVNCAELDFNVPIMKACIKMKKSCTDLGGLQRITIEQFKLHNQFKNKGIINITGCGSTPGISNVMASFGIKKFDSVDTIQLGFSWNSNIKKFVVPYSMKSIFKEFTEKPIILFNGKFVSSDRGVCTGFVDFKEIGRQKVYCIVHSEVYTFTKYFKNKGLKNINYMAGFPEHSMNSIKNLMEMGFNSEEKIEINGIKISPLNFTNRILKKIKPPKNYKEVENLWVKIIGEKNGKNKESSLNCIVRSVKGWEDAGSNIDTGMTISIISQMLKKGLIKPSGVFAPEAVIPEKHFFEELKKRKMFVFENGKRIN